MAGVFICMMKQYPYMICYRLPSTGNKYHYKHVDAACQNEARKLFEASMPSAEIRSAHPLPQNYKR